MLRADGTFCAKFFKMADLSYLHAMLKQMFRDVYVVKPESSRNSSAESFVVGLGFRASFAQGRDKLVLSESLSALKSGPESTLAPVEESKEEDPQNESGAAIQGKTELLSSDFAAKEDSEDEE